MNAEPILVFLNKAGREIDVMLQQGPPRIGDGVISKSNKLYRVKDVVWHSYWSKHNTSIIKTEIRIYLEPPERDKK